MQFDTELMHLFGLFATLVEFKHLKKNSQLIFRFIIDHNLMERIGKSQMISDSLKQTYFKYIFFLIYFYFINLILFLFYYFIFISILLFYFYFYFIILLLFLF